MQSLPRDARANSFFERTAITTEVHGTAELLDGGFVANNPALFAVSDAISGFWVPPAQIRLLSIGTGEYAQPRYPFWKRWFLSLRPVELFQLVLSANANSMEILLDLLFPELRQVRINETFADEDSATDLLEDDPDKLRLLEQLGRNSFGTFETEVMQLLTE